MHSVLKSPIIYYGGKRRIAAKVWKAFGSVRRYVEPFFGGGSVLLGRPMPIVGAETVNDLDGFVCNFWRAVKHAPDEVALYADWPVSELDIAARGAWLAEQIVGMEQRLVSDPEWFDAKAAGYWVWGTAVWMGGGFAELGKSQRKLPFLGNPRGVAAARKTESGVRRWMRFLSERLRLVEVACGDWTRVCGGASSDAMEAILHHGSPVAFFLDPPYDTSMRAEGCYRADDSGVSAAVRDWAVRWGADSRFRIALCGYEGEHDMPEDWRVLKWKATGGFSLKIEGRGAENARKERVWFSPHCLSNSILGFDL